PALTPSCYHGVTTVVAGNCGFSIAPTRPEHRELIARTPRGAHGPHRAGARFRLGGWLEPAEGCHGGLRGLRIHLGCLIAIVAAPRWIRTRGKVALRRGARSSSIRWQPDRDLTTSRLRCRCSGKGITQEIRYHAVVMGRSRRQQRSKG